MKEKKSADSVPVTWLEIVRAQKALTEEPSAAKVAIYKSLVQSTESNHPYHLLPILRQLERVKKSTGKAPSEIRILDHGCGGGGTLMYLAALGYSDVYGVDIGGPMDKIDRTVRALSGADKVHVTVYDGYTLPFTDRTIDLIFSQQVMEHVKDQFIEFFIDEEVRILNDNGIVYHQIPHRWTPWESHTKTWFIHYFPRFLRRPVYRLFGHDPDYLDEMLHLRSPLYFYRKFRRAFSDYRNETLDRLALRPDPSYYDGNIRLRSLISQLAVLPIIRNLIVHFVMIDLAAGRSIVSR
jgi:SAM-dependent methyltransferase